MLGANWSVVPPTSTQLIAMESGAFVAKTELFIQAEIDGVTKQLYGVGAMTNRDPDMAMKTALAEAIKKAFHQAGVALYLWDAEARDRVTKKSELARAPIARLKKEVKRIALERLGKDEATAKEVAGVFGLKASDLAEDDTIRKILQDEGLL